MRFQIAVNDILTMQGFDREHNLRDVEFGNVFIQGTIKGEDIAEIPSFHVLKQEKEIIILSEGEIGLDNEIPIEELENVFFGHESIDVVSF